MLQFERNRDANLAAANIKPGFDQGKPWAIEHTKSEVIRDNVPGGIRSGEQMHHLIPVDLWSAMIQGRSDRDIAIITNRAHQLGLRPGNDPVNFVGLDPYKEHVTNETYSNTAHDQLNDIGLEIKDLSGPERQQYLDLQTKLVNSDINTILAALPDFGKWVAEPAMEIGRSFRPKAQGIEENKRQYARELAQERIRETQLYEQEMMKAAKKKYTGSDIVKGVLNDTPFVI